MRIQTSHENLRVFVDGRAMGVTPLGVLKLPTGEHQLLLPHPNRVNWLDRDWVANVMIPEGDTLVVEVVFENSFKIDSQPFGAALFLNEKQIGTTPYFLKLRETDAASVRLHKAGFVDTTLYIQGAGPRHFEVTLRPVEPSLQFQTRRAQTERRRSKFKKIMYSTLGLAVASGALALYFRKKGNDSYDRYLSTGDPQRFNRFLDDAKRYDRYAAISFGMFQASFAVSFYLFIKEVNR